MPSAPLRGRTRGTVFKLIIFFFGNSSERRTQLFLQFWKLRHEVHVLFNFNFPENFSIFSYFIDGTWKQLFVKNIFFNSMSSTNMFSKSLPTLHTKFKKKCFEKLT